MNFGEAVEKLKQGELLQRVGWNGKGLFVFMQIPADISIEIVPKMQSLPQKVKDLFLLRYNSNPYAKEYTPLLFREIHYSNQLAIVDENNGIKGWAPSVSDAFAEDWIIYK